MDIRKLTDRYSVAPQIAPGDMAALASEGFVAVIDNRPDAEVTSDLASNAMALAAAEAGLAFHLNTVTNGAMTEGNVTEQARILAQARGPVLAYCRSGTRSCVVWALGADGGADALIAAASGAGYDIAGLRPQLEAAARR